MIKYMTEKIPGIFEIVFHSKLHGMSRVKVFLIKGKKGKRSLLIDAGFRNGESFNVLNEALNELEIAPDELDVFLTHKHSDHCGQAAVLARQGARLFMNPREETHKYDCMYCGRGRQWKQEQVHILRSVGVTSELEPQIWNYYMEFNKRAESSKDWLLTVDDFPYHSVNAGDRLSYGDYELEAVALDGHTLGQLGLYDEEKKILFSADYIIKGMAPVIGTAYPDDQLLDKYFKSMEYIKKRCKGSLMIPSHGTALNDIETAAESMRVSYENKIAMAEEILEKHEKRTIKDIACLVYGIERIPENDKEFMKLKTAITITFSCLEYLKDMKRAARTEDNGIFYYEICGKTK